MERKKKSTFIRRSMAMLLVFFSLCPVIFAGCSADSSTKEVVIGIAWRGDTDSEYSYVFPKFE